MGGNGVAEHLIGAGRHEEVEVARRQLDALTRFKFAREAAIEIGQACHVSSFPNASVVQRSSRVTTAVDLKIDAGSEHGCRRRSKVVCKIVT
jgi:hypothetical protein